MVIVGNLDRLDQQCTGSLKTAYRPNTLRSYKSKINVYLRFCQFYGLQPFPAEEWQLVRFARYLANGVTSYDTVKGYLSTIKTSHEIGKFPFPKDVSTLRLELRSIKFELAGPVKKAMPITPKKICSIYSVIQLGNPLHVAGYLALLVGFYLFLRKSNLVPDTQDSFNGKEQLKWENVWWWGSVLMVTVEWSKTRQYRDKPLDLPLIRCKDIRLCLIYWISYVKLKFSPKPQDPLFSYPVQGKMTPITYPVLSKLLKSWVQEAGACEPTDSVTLHGLRRGGANHALTVGLAGEDLMLMGDWASDAYMEYIDLSLERRVRNVVQFVECLEQMIGDDAQEDEWEEILNFPA